LEAVRQFQCVWDTTHNLCKDRNAKANAWKQLSLGGSCSSFDNSLPSPINLSFPPMQRGKQKRKATTTTDDLILKQMQHRMIVYHPLKKILCIF